MSPSFDDPGYANANVIGQSWSCQQACGSRMAVHMSPSFNHPGRVYANELGQSWSCKQAGRAYANKHGPSWSCLRQHIWCTKTLCQLLVTCQVDKVARHIDVCWLSFPQLRKTLTVTTSVQAVLYTLVLVKAVTMRLHAA